MTGRVVHFEVPFSDGERAKKFYKQIFGWQLNEMPEMKYTIVSTGPAAETGMPAEPGYIGGGMFEREPVLPQGPVITSTWTALMTRSRRSSRWAASLWARRRPSVKWDSPLTSKTPRATSWACGRPPRRRRDSPVSRMRTPKQASARRAGSRCGSPWSAAGGASLEVAATSGRRRRQPLGHLPGGRYRRQRN